MSLQTCWRCLLRPSLPTISSFSKLLRPAAAFSTTSTKQSKPLPPPATRRGVKTNFVMKKKTRSAELRSKRPQPGERKAMRKRIVLSNVNALAVEDLQDLTAESIVDSRLRSKVVGISGPIIDQLRVMDAFKPTQSWGLFRRPAMLMRRETLQYGKIIEEMSGDGTKRTVRRVIVGERGSGKTTMLLQAMTMAFLKNWVVINLPEAQDIIIGHTEYSPIPQTSPTLYAQKSYIAAILSTISRANPILADLKLTLPPTPQIPIPIPPSISLARLALLGSQDPDSAPQIFNLLLQELSLPNRPPLCICLDGLAHAMCDSAYKTPAFQPIHAHDLSIIRWFMDFLSGARELSNGGLVLAATNESNKIRVPALDLGIAELEARSASPHSLPPSSPSSSIPTPYHPPIRNPFAHYDARVLAVFESHPAGLAVQRLGGVTKDDARGLLEYWASSGVLRHRVSDGLVGEKWTLSGGGVVGELERASVLMRV